EWACDYTIDAHVTDVAAVIGHFGWRRVHLVGMSLGAVIAAHYAALGDARVASLTMVDVGPKPDFEATAGMRSFMAQPIAHLTLEELTDAAARIASNGGYDKILYRYMHMTCSAPDGKLMWRHDQARRKPSDFAHVLGKLDELEALASAVKCRVLIARGGQ